MPFALKVQECDAKQPPRARLPVTPFKNTSPATCSYLTDAVYICHPLKQQNQLKDGSKN
jgi:hypothetical protein